jgi:F0F1-type ATP synthase membrane subunit c/vacuolar-type H+-ATPase subunit K
VLGLRSALRRPVRTIANATELAMGVAMVILGLGASKLAGDYLASPARDEEEAPTRTVIAIQTDQALTIVFIGAGLLIGLAALHAMIATIFAARDSAGSDPARPTTSPSP